MLVGENLLLDRAVEKVADHAIDRAAVSLDEDAGLAGGDEFAVVPALRESPRDLNRDDHLAAATVLAHGVNPQAARAEALELRHVPLVVLADVDQLYAMLRGRGGKLRIVAQELVQPGDHVAAAGHRLEQNRPPGRRNLPAPRCGANQGRVCPRGTRDRRTPGTRPSG